MPKRYKLFIDESGNAGANLLDSQPVFILVGLLVPDQRISKLTRDVERLKVSRGLPALEEVKGSDLLRDNHIFVKDVVQIIASQHLPVFGVAVERKYMISSLIVYDFFDPGFNDSLRGRKGYGIHLLYRPLADSLFQTLSAETNHLAATALIKGDEKDLKELLHRVQIEMRGIVIDSINISEVVKDVESHISELSESIKDTYHRSKYPVATNRGVIKSPNYGSFAEIVMRLEQMFKNKPPAEVDIVFDSSTQFDRSFGSLFESIKNAKPSEIKVNEESRITLGGGTVQSFATEDSRNSAMLQCADIVAVGIRKVIEACTSLKDLQLTENNLVVQEFLPLTIDLLDRELLHMVASPHVFVKLWNARKSLSKKINRAPRLS